MKKLYIGGIKPKVKKNYDKEIIFNETYSKIIPSMNSDYLNCICENCEGKCNNITENQKLCCYCSKIPLENMCIYCKTDTKEIEEEVNKEKQRLSNLSNRKSISRWFFMIIGFLVIITLTIAVPLFINGLMGAQMDYTLLLMTCASIGLLWIILTVYSDSFQKKFS